MIKEKIVIVTGGAGLLGKEFIRAIIQNGGIGIIADINQIEGKNIKENIVKEINTDKIDVIKLDTTSKESIKKCINYLYSHYGRIDALVNSAYPRNKNYGKHFFEVKYTDFCENVNIHLGGYFLISQQFALYFKKQGYGNIVNIASIQGVCAPKFDTYEGTPMTSPVEYSAIKAAIINLTKYMAKYLKGMNIRVNSISPGGIFNNQPEEFIIRYKHYCINKGILETFDISGTLVFLLSDMSKYINGQNIIVDDGWTL